MASRRFKPEGELTMRRTGTGSGGGTGMNKVVQKPVKTGGPNRAKSPAAVNQLGSHVGNAKAVAKLDAGPALPSKLGNEVALNSKSAPGQGRTLHGKAGTQGQHGAAVPDRNEHGTKPLRP